MIGALIFLGCPPRMMIRIAGGDLNAVVGLVGFAAGILSGCPFRQVVLAGSGNSDAGISVLGMTLGAAFAHNFDLTSAAGITGMQNSVFLLS